MSSPHRSLLVSRLHALLAHYPAARCWVAYSGGLDSHVLLHAMASLRGRLPEIAVEAIHVNHALQIHAQQWAEHCALTCAALQLPCHVLHVNAASAVGESPEAAARHARYQAFSGMMRKGDILLTAHQRDDQAETLLLQLLRGAGLHGLAAMPVSARFGAGMHLRPLLEFTRAQLQHYAHEQQLASIEDPSNAETSFDRNYVRHEIMPRLEARWPAVSNTFARSARHAADAACLLDAMAQGDFAQVADESGGLSVARLRTLESPRQRNILRAWFRQLRLSLPSTAHIEHILHDMVAVASDRVPCVRWQGVEVRRYRDLLYALPPLQAHDAAMVLPWDMQRPLPLPADLGTLSAIPAQGCGLKASLCGAADVSVRFRRGGERCRPARRGHSHELRKLYQEAGIPPWQRDRIPLIYVGPTLAAVGALWCCEPLHAGPGEDGLLIIQQAWSGA
ncbi:MAG: tRNA lysidine(34) synthetase TilS [Gammaproteobacteria bacterium]|nr:tRNA lysidine(34) synthetase TilS [Gammaproteobacteria bacterium]